ncbi:MAG: hypothetical protein U0401_17720 [Anaerolineae bacterium]
MWSNITVKENAILTINEDKALDLHAYRKAEELLQSALRNEPPPKIRPVAGTATFSGSGHLELEHLNPDDHQARRQVFDRPRPGSRQK